MKTPPPTVETRFDRFVAWYFIKAGSRQKASGYLGFMAISAPATFISAATGIHQLGLIFLWGTALLDLGLHISQQVKTRLPMSMPIGLLVIAGTLIADYFKG